MLWAMQAGLRYSIGDSKPTEALYAQGQANIQC